MPLKLDWEKIAPVGGQLADFITTRDGLSRGGTELNPAMRPIVGKPSAFLALKLGVGLGMALAVGALQKKGHRRAAKVTSIVATIMGAGPAVNNIVRGRL